MGQKATVPFSDQYVSTSSAPIELCLCSFCTLFTLVGNLHPQSNIFLNRSNMTDYCDRTDASVLDRYATLFSKTLVVRHFSILFCVLVCYIPLTKRNNLAII